MTKKLTLNDINVRGKKVLIRVDYNVPIKNNEVADDTRIRASLPTLNYLLEQKAKIILMTHLGRPRGFDKKLKLDPVAKKLSTLLKRKIKKADETICNRVTEKVNHLQPGEILLLENLRFNAGEKENEPKFVEKLASLANIYVNDAFGTAHRAHASTYGVPQKLPIKVAGFLLEKELKNLNYLLANPKRPFFAVLGGSKVSDKIDVIDKFTDIVDGIFTGGGMIFTFLKAQGIQIGKSLVEKTQVRHALAMLEKAKDNNVDFYLPIDVIIAKEFNANSEYKAVAIDEIPSDWTGLDIGPQTSKLYASKIAKAQTIFWNGPMGVFEIKQFSNGTKEVANAIANSKATTIVGGGDSDRALRRFGLEKKVSFVSTGGGASLKVLEGTKLPGVEVLQDKEEEYTQAREAGN